MDFMIKPRIDIINIIPFYQVFSDSVSQEDEVNFYFDLLSNNQFQLTLSGMTAEINVLLLNSLDQVSDFSINEENKDESPVQSLDSGTINPDQL
jgi:hypothetical protein